MPIGSKRRPFSEWDSPAAPSSRKRFISAMPSSICWPSGVNSHFAVDGIFSEMKVSVWALRANSLRRFTQGPRLVVPVTSGDMVTMRAANSVSVLEMSSRMRPKPAWVEISRSARVAIAGTGIGRSACRRVPSAKNGMSARKARRASGSSTVA